MAKVEAKDKFIEVRLYGKEFYGVVESKMFAGTLYNRLAVMLCDYYGIDNVDMRISGVKLSPNERYRMYISVKAMFDDITREV